MTLHTVLLSFAVVAALLAVIPGLDTAIVLRSAISQGRGHAYATALGVNCGALLWGIAAAVGASAVLAASHTAYTALKVTGAAYMIWLASRCSGPVAAVRTSSLPKRPELDRCVQRGSGDSGPMCSTRKSVSSTSR